MAAFGRKHVWVMGHDSIASAFELFRGFVPWFVDILDTLLIVGRKTEERRHAAR